MSDQHVQPMLSASAQIPPKAAGHALVVGGDSCRALPVRVLGSLGYGLDEREDPYAAMLELCRRPLVYRSLVISLQSLYRDELALIQAVRKRFPHVSIWLTHIDGRQAALAEAMRLGAEAIVAEDGVHAFADTAASTTLAPAAARPMQFRPVPDEPAEPQPAETTPPPAQPPATRPTQYTPAEPVLTADELRALLGDEDLT